MVRPAFYVELLALLGLLMYTCETHRTNNLTQAMLEHIRDNDTSSSAKSERLIGETHTLAENARVQVANTKEMAESAKDQVTQLKGMVTASSNQTKVLSGQLTVMQQQLESVDRPWITASIDIEDDLRFTESNKGRIAIGHTVNNTGRSAATDVSFLMQPIILQGPEIMDWSKPVNAQKELCKQVAQLAGPEAIPTGDVIYPNIPSAVPAGGFIGIGLKTFVQSDTGPKFPTDFLKDFEFFIAGCIDYRYGTSIRHHQSGFVYQLTRSQGTMFTSGVDVPKEQFIIRRWELGGGWFAN
jgi:hypothetical protein